jgi:hypothetical protein
VLALWLLPGVVGASPRWMPGLALADVLAIVGRGRVPAAPGLVECGGTLALVLAALAFPAWSASAWRRSR